VVDDRLDLRRYQMPSWPPVHLRCLPIRSPRTSGFKENDPEGVAFEYEVLE